MRRMYSKPQLLEAVEQESKLNGIKVFENIVDKDGHLRFIEGEIIDNSTGVEGLTIDYGKWALSGTHLLIVVGITAANGTIIPNGIRFKLKDLPQWVKDKIYPLFGGIEIERKIITLTANDFTAQNLTCLLEKTSGEIVIYCGTLTLTATRYGRLSFDLLIDNN